jgi:hypothetical protein
VRAARAGQSRPEPYGDEPGDAAFDGAGEAGGGDDAGGVDDGRRVGTTGGAEVGTTGGRVTTAVGVDVAVAVAVGAVVAVLVPLDPTFTFGGNCLTGSPCNAWSMYCLKICAGTVPP